jgi:hypothetical protein
MGALPGKIWNLGRLRRGCSGRICCPQWPSNDREHLGKMMETDDEVDLWDALNTMVIPACKLIYGRFTVSSTSKTHD